MTYEFGEEINFKIRQLGGKGNTDKSMTKIPYSLAIMVSGISTKFLSENPKELCDKVKLILQEKQAGNFSNVIDEEIIAIAEKVLKYICISKKKHKFLLLKCLN